MRGLPPVQERTLRAAHGIGHQEPAALPLGNSLDAVHVWSGIRLGGRVEVPVNTAYKGRFRVVPLADKESHGEASPAAGNYGELMAYMYTSGTTGASKGVLVSHAHAYPYASREHLDRPRAGDRILVTLPLFHLAGQWYGVYQGLIHQVPCNVTPGFSVSRCWDDALRRRGENVASFEVERVIDEHPAVFERAVVRRVHKHLLRGAGIGPASWDREAAEIVLRQASR